MFHDFYNIYKTGFTYYDVFFNITFIVLILIISSIIYWDLVNKNSLAKSSCNNIKEIIEQNANSVEPYIYNIIIIKTDTIYDINYKNYAIKITYNFKKQKTDIDIKDIKDFNNKKYKGSMFANADDSDSDIRIPNENIKITTWGDDADIEIKWKAIDDKIEINNFSSTTLDLNGSYTISEDCASKNKGCTYNNKKVYYKDTNTFIEYSAQDGKGYENWHLVYFSSETSSSSTKLTFKVKKNILITYYDLSSGQKKNINNIYYSEYNKNKLKEYEFICVDKNYKRIKTKAAKLLCTFTKEYLFNDLYSKAIIDNINIANKKKYKIVL